MIANIPSTQRDFALDTLCAMKKQEDAIYHISTQHLKGMKNVSTYLTWRGKMVEWYYSIAEVYHFSKESVEVAISILDRYVTINTELIFDSKKYKTACMACFYISSKIHEAQCLTPRQMSILGRGACTPQDIEKLELDILSSIQWRVNPPTSISFARTLLELVPLDRIPDRTSILEAVEKQIKLAAADRNFMANQASFLGFAALINAIQDALGSSRYFYCYHLFSQHLGFESGYDKLRLDELQKELSLLTGINIKHVMNDKEMSVCSEDERATEPCKRKPYVTQQAPESPTSVVIRRQLGVKMWETYIEATR